MEYEVVVPEMDLPTATLILSGWLANSGDLVEFGSPLCEVCAGDILMEIVARHEGIFRRSLLEVDQCLTVGMPLGVIEISECEPA